MNFDRYVITTWPGYFFQTVLCIRSIVEHFPKLPISIIVDADHTNGFPIKDPWPNFFQDLKIYLKNQHLPMDRISFHRFSDVESIKHCDVGWWRQQYVKCCLDQYLHDDSWLVIDADIIFNQMLDFSFVPVNVDWHGSRDTDSITVGNQLYVAHMLGTDKNSIRCHGKLASASAVPFRQLNRSLLYDLRKHVEQLHQKDFVQMQIDMCNRGDIVAYDPECKKMIMSEFELIECFRAYISNQAMPIQFVGSNHTYTLDCQGTYQYRHSSLPDWALGHLWLQSQGLAITEHEWQMSKQFKENMPLLSK